MFRAARYVPEVVEVIPSSLEDKTPFQIFENKLFRAWRYRQSIHTTEASCHVTFDSTYLTEATLDTIPIQLLSDYIIQQIVSLNCQEDYPRGVCSISKSRAGISIRGPCDVALSVVPKMFGCYVDLTQSSCYMETSFDGYKTSYVKSLKSQGPLDRASQLFDLVMRQGVLGTKVDHLESLYAQIENASFDEFQTYLADCWKDLQVQVVFSGNIPDTPNFDNLIESMEDYELPHSIQHAEGIQGRHNLPQSDQLSTTTGTVIEYNIHSPFQQQVLMSCFRVGDRSNATEAECLVLSGLLTMAFGNQSLSGKVQVSEPMRGKSDTVLALYIVDNDTSIEPEKLKATMNDYIQSGLAYIDNLG